MSSHLTTDAYFRCIDWETVYQAVQNDRLDSAYYYEFNRTYQITNWPKRDICEPPKTESRPLGDPNGEYFKCYSGELYYLFGNLARDDLPMRDEFDLPFQQFVVDSFSSFATTYDPDPDFAFLQARGYDDTLRAVQHDGRWNPVTKDRAPVRILQWSEY
ncbi:hypothetical protein GGS20DRAFT_551053 [Poronia punctata]|nr:hypothetical protein GGS20DRAFT_551053 [Poronia punctata]